MIAPLTLEEALGALDGQPDALILAGGTDLMVEINGGHRALTGDETVIAVNRVAELRGWTHDPNERTLRIGAAVPYRELEQPPLATLVPALAQASRTVGSPQIRHAGTIGGNLGTCSPAGDGLPVLAALDAMVELRGPDGMRLLPVVDFMTGVKQNARRPGELIVAVTLPLLEGWQGYAKVGVRNAMVIAIASACLAVDEPSRSIRIALGSVGPTILRAVDAESFATGAVEWSASSVDDASVTEFGRLVAAAARPIDDHRASAAYRRRAVEVLARRLLRRAFPTGGAEAAGR